MYKVGDSLLSDITFTSQPRLPIYAIHKSNVKGLKIIDELIKYDLQTKIQVWDYNHLIFSKDNKTIDNLSLITSYLNDDDERIEKRLEQLLGTKLK